MWISPITRKKNCLQAIKFKIMVYTHVHYTLYCCCCWHIFLCFDDFVDSLRQKAQLKHSMWVLCSADVSNSKYQVAYFVLNCSLLCGPRLKVKKKTFYWNTFISLITYKFNSVLLKHLNKRIFNNLWNFIFSKLNKIIYRRQVLFFK